MLTLTRIWLPVGLALTGLVFAIVGHGKTVLAAVGVCLILIGLSVWLLNLMFRLSVQSNKERDQEERAREYFDVHGRWPDE
jgi:membrane protein required for beta-lactamase induction